MSCGDDTRSPDPVEPVTRTDEDGSAGETR